LGLQAFGRRDIGGLVAPGAAQEKVWKHGLINAKADAGIFLMVSTRDFAKKQGLKIEISQFKDDQLALKALIAGELDSFEGGPQGVFAPTPRRRRQAAGLPLDCRAARHLCH
jgi:ABC-type nitrate/sulfonate/bicarbonate transport system substrate-binding protein